MKYVMEGEDGASGRTASDPLTVVDVKNCTCINSRADTHLLYASYIKILNIMLRHMLVPRDTSVYHEIISVCCESLGNCQILSKDGPS